jgi:hypothetical protein
MEGYLHAGVPVHVERLYGVQFHNLVMHLAEMVFTRPKRTSVITRTMDVEAQAKTLRLRMYVLCSECARLIDLAQGNYPGRPVERTDLIRHVSEEHAFWLALGLHELAGPE